VVAVNYYIVSRFMACVFIREINNINIIVIAINSFVFLLAIILVTTIKKQRIEILVYYV
jgi:hypothetical protein